MKRMTAFERRACIYRALGTGSVWVGFGYLAYVAVHFINKFW